MNSSDQQRLKELMLQWQNNTLPPHFQSELLGLLERPDLNHHLTEDMQKIWGETEKADIFSARQKEGMLASIVNYQQPKRFTIRYIAAAAVLLVAIVTIALLRKPPEKENVAIKQFDPPRHTVDIAAPATNKAILTLADGRQIILEDIGEGKLATEGNINVLKLKSGQLVYSGSATAVKWNTLTVPNGSKPMQLTLSDGSQVTLNVGSSLTYPTAFSGNSRNVTMTGEAYFQIARLPSPAGTGNMPFIVATNGMSVEVKGTKFNVNAYTDEGTTKTTLVEGAVNIVAGNQRQAIEPGEQAIVSTDFSKGMEVEKNADVDEATAWLNDKFRFQNADVEAVMRQVARWYNVEVKFAAKPRLRFGGQIDRNSTLRQMFAILETSGLHFSLTGNVVTILP
jgi:hypothetical protein